MSQVSLGRPEFVPGTPPGHPTAKFLHVIFLYRFFSLHIERTAGDLCEERLNGELVTESTPRRSPGTWESHFPLGTVCPVAPTIGNEIVRVH